MSSLSDSLKIIELEEKLNQIELKFNILSNYLELICSYKPNINKLNDIIAKFHNDIYEVINENNCSNVDLEKVKHECELISQLQYNNLSIQQDWIQIKKLLPNSRFVSTNTEFINIYIDIFHIQMVIKGINTIIGKNNIPYVIFENSSLIMNYNDIDVSIINAFDNTKLFFNHKKKITDSKEIIFLICVLISMKNNGNIMIDNNKLIFSLKVVDFKYENDTEPSIINHTEPSIHTELEQRSSLNDTSIIEPKPTPPLPILHINTSLNILVVDDNVILTRMMKQILIKMKHNVTVKSNGQDAIEEFKKNRYSIVFLDILLPIKNGIQVTKEIREFEKEFRTEEDPVPIIGISGDTSKEQAAIKNGMTDFVSKGKDLQSKTIEELLLKYCGK